MAGEIGDGAPNLWPAGWYHPEVLTTAQTPAELRAWLWSGLDARIRSFAWWASASESEGFLLLYHQSVAQLGFWLSPGLRGRGWGKVALRRALTQLPNDANTVVLAEIAKENTVANRTARAGGLRLIADQAHRTIFTPERSILRGET
ncbi:GNAT family N-acetyltransferase [Rhodovulum viride]|uniref:GNAT family N-acetyltransferase n=1 Tax=Rhodovulum viride TaxID=1231134 RepID=UPI0011BE3041|nr:GNAT family N-acetyltransferase [Rhodovulum viride]